MGNFEGVLFTLKKRIQAIAVDDSEYYKFQVFGYYDGLDINVVDKWYDLRPKGLQKYGLQVDLETPFIDQYTIRTLIPENREELEREGFAYSFWENLGKVRNDKFNEFEKEVRDRFPFIAMSVVNLSEMYVREKDDMMAIQTGIVDALQDSINLLGYSLSELHCAVFPAIGYSDYIIAFLVDDLKKAADVIGNIRGMLFSEKNAIISNCYTICGIDRNCFKNAGSMVQVKDQENARVTIRINLKEGISTYDFKEHFKAILIKNKELDNSALLEELDDSYFITFGNSDCFILPSKPLNYYLKLYATKQILHPESTFFKTYITNIRTSVRISCNETKKSSHKLEEELTETIEKQKYEEEFQQFIDIYERFLTENNMHIRTSKSLQQIMKNYMDIAKTRHGFDVDYILGNAFMVLIENIVYYICLYNDMAAQKAADTELQELKISIVEAVSIFKDYIGVLVADLVRSDRPFIEGNTLTHPSIASATKLMFAYNAMLENLVFKFQEDRKFTFIVTSGGCDLTAAIDLFSFAMPEEEINKLVVITVPEMSLYDIQGTLFRILHECMHFIGDRKRKERFSHLVKALSDTIALNIMSIEKSNKDYILENIGDLVGDETDLMEKIKNCIDEIHEIKTEEIREIICNAEVFTKYKQNMSDYEYYGEILCNTVLSQKEIIHLFNINEGPDTGIIKQIYDVLSKEHMESLEECRKILNNKYKTLKGVNETAAMHIRFALAFLDQMYHEYSYWINGETKQDKELMDTLIGYIELLLGNNVVVKKTKWISKVCNTETTAESEKIATEASGFENQNYDGINNSTEHLSNSGMMLKWNYLELRDLILSAMVESFSDCAAVHILDMPEEDFLLSFIYELWDQERAFPLELEDVLRLGADMEVIYNKVGELEPATVDAIRRKAINRNLQGYTYQNIDEMLIRVNKILADYQSFELSGIRKELVAYLHVCIEEPKKWYSEELGRLYKLCDMDTSKKIYQAAETLFNFWKNISNEESENESRRCTIS